MFFEYFTAKVAGDVYYCEKKICECLSNLTTLHKSFDKFWKKQTLNQLKEIPCQKTNRVNDIGSCSAKKSTLRQLFFEIIDTLKGQINAKFSDTDKVKFLALLNCKI